MHSELAQAIAFLGNSLLRPMSQTGSFGLDKGFWDDFPTFGDDRVEEAVRRMSDYVEPLDDGDAGDGREDASRRISVEFTRLFVGPPSPRVHPWETYYADKSATTGYGAPAIDVNECLKSLDLKIGGEGNQFPDHMGIELLCLAEQLSRANQHAFPLGSAVSFCVEHPQSWIEDLHTAVSAEAPGGYYDHLLDIARCVLAIVPSCCEVKPIV